MKYFCSIFFSTLLLSSLQAESYEKPVSKIYVSAHSIYINNDGIYFIQNDVCIPLESVSRDENGLYIKEYEMKGGDWTCIYCGAPNTVADRKCYKCYRGR